MGTEMNHVRAMRMAEIIQEFRNLQHYIHQIRLSPPPEGESNPRGQGYTLLQECLNEGRAVLKAPFDDTTPSPNGDAEKEMAQLKQVMVDASVRRFQAQRIYLRATAAMRWINSRNAVIKDKKPSKGREAALESVDKALQQGLKQELDGITDEKVYEDLRSNDAQQGKWLDEDPDLSTIQRFLA